MKDEIQSQTENKNIEAGDGDLNAAASDASQIHTDAVDEKIAAKPQSNKKRPASPLGQAVSGNSTDTVRLSAIVFKNLYAKKSLSVHHLQRRLGELGYYDAWSDINGWYGDLTKTSISAYQKDYGIAGDGEINMETLESLFIDDGNVEVAE